MTGSFFQEATILESHGIDVQSPGGHSNSDDVDANDYNEQVRESNDSSQLKEPASFCLLIKFC